MEIKNELMEQFKKDAEVLMAEELLELKGGDVPPPEKPCACCCSERNGGAAKF